MTSYKVNMWVSATAPVPWTNLSSQGNDVKALGDGWSINYVPGRNPLGAINNLTGTPSGAAAWVDAAAVSSTGHYVGTGGCDILISGPPGGQYKLQVFGLRGAGRVTEWSIDGGTPIEQDNGDSSDSPELTGTLNGAGESVVTYKRAPASTGDAYANAVLLTPVSDPSVTLSTDLQPGESFTATAANFTATPVSPATVSDGTTTVSVPVTVTGTGPYTITGTMPALTDGGTSPKFGSVTFEIGTA